MNAERESTEGRGRASQPDPVYRFPRYLPGTKKSTKLYTAWTNMKGRCYNANNPKYGRYGGRGIKVDAAWKDDFQEFARWATANGYSDELSLDRYPDNDADYSPGNCRWATTVEQCRNRSTSRLIAAFGETKTLAAWCSDVRCGVNNSATITDRIKRGWIVEDAIATPRWIRGSVSEGIKRSLFSGPPEFTARELEEEEWKPVVGWKSYEVSSLGRVLSHCGLKPRILKTLYSKEDGRASVNLYRGDGSGGRPTLLAKLVLQAHVGVRPEGLMACHFPDPNPANCRLSNLRWDTASENNRDKTRLNELIIAIIENK